MELMNEEKVEKPSTAHQWLCALLANIPVITYGIYSGWMSPMGKLLKSSQSPTGRAVTDEEISWMASSSAITAFLGVIFFSYVSDRFGRRPALLILSIPHLVATIIKLKLVYPETLIAARCIQGISSGGCFVVPSMYTKEISDDSIRGTLGSIIMMFQNSGILGVYIMGAFLDYYTILYICLPLPILHILITIWSPETPAYLVKRNKIRQATKALAWLNGVSETNLTVQGEISKLTEKQEQFNRMERLSYRSILYSKSKRKAVLIGMCLLTVQAAGGSYVILVYASTILERCTSENTNTDMQVISLAAFLILGVMSSMIVIERVGRRILFLIGSSMLTICSLCIAAALYLHTVMKYELSVWYPVIILTVAMFSYGFGVASMPYIIMAEIFTFQLRARMLTMAMLYGWLANFVAVKLLDPVTKEFGMHVMFIIYTGINIFGVLFTLFYLPETKAKNIDEIESLLGGKK